MSKKAIFAIGLDWPDVDGMQEHAINSDVSLLDADIVLFRPNFSEFSSYDSFQGRPLLPEHHSFLAREKIKHWAS